MPSKLRTSRPRRLGPGGGLCIVVLITLLSGLLVSTLNAIKVLGLPLGFWTTSQIVPALLAVIVIIRTSRAES